MTESKQYDLCVIGGAGHVGLPLGVTFANAGLKKVLLDINEEALAKIRAGKFPFKEIGGNEALRSALDKNCLFIAHSPEAIAESEYVVIVVGTPIDEYLSPRFGSITKVLDQYIRYFRDGQTLILRSTVYPGTTEKIRDYFLKKNKRVGVAYCPERVAQGHAIEELKTLPQIVSAFDNETLDKVSSIFKKIVSADVIVVKPIEAELAKIFTNTWRYIKFAAANQFFMIARDLGLDYHTIHKAMVREYPRNRDLPSPGFAAGPCLLKDTAQLVAFTNNSFWIGHAAMLINEGLVNHVIKELKRDYPYSLKEKTIGILGMAFKGDLDDPRDSLSYKLRKIAQLECKNVLCTDVYIQDPGFVPTETVLRHSDIIVLAATHEEYGNIDPRQYPNKKFIDVWNFWNLT